MARLQTLQRLWVVPVVLLGEAASGMASALSDAVGSRSITVGSRSITVAGWEIPESQLPMLLLYGLLFAMLLRRRILG